MSDDTKEALVPQETMEQSADAQQRHKDALVRRGISSENVYELREASFILPTVAENIEDMVKQIFTMLSMRFGGCTMVPLIGAWAKPGGPEGAVAMVVTEPGMEFRCAITAGDEPDFWAFAMGAARAFKQEALYWRDRAGVSHIVATQEGTIH